MYKGMEEESQVLHDQWAVAVTRPYIKLRQNRLNSESTKPCDFLSKSSAVLCKFDQEGSLFFFFGRKFFKIPHADLIYTLASSSWGGKKV